MNLKIDEVTKNMNQLGFDVVFYGVDSKADADASFVGLPGCSAFTSPVKSLFPVLHIINCGKCFRTRAV